MADVWDRGRSAAEIDRDSQEAAKQLNQLLRSEAPWSKQVEHWREKIRDCQLLLLFGFSLTPFATSLDHVWLQSSYNIIQRYRERLSSTEAELSATLESGGKRNKINNNPRYIQYKKLIARFRQHLSSEETFYRNLIVRIVSFHQLQPYVASHLRRGASINVPPMIEGGGPEQGLGPHLAMDDIKVKIGLVHKALICLGDLERYKELCEDYTKAEVLETRASKARMMDKFNKASSYYEAARVLKPHDGTAFNQFAVISTYVGDEFSSAYYYLRAYAVRHPFRQIEDIIERFLGKIYEKWRVEQRSSSSEARQTSDGDPVETLKIDVVVLVAILYRRIGISSLAKLHLKTLNALEQQLQTRQLASESIVKIVVLAISTHWHALNNAFSDAKEPPDLHTRRQTAEAGAVSFLFGVFNKLLLVAHREIADPLHNAPGHSDAHPRGNGEISAVLRRLLPSLRILSKWLKAHLDYIHRLSGPDTPTLVRNSVDEFWIAYSDFARVLREVYPASELPELTHRLDEDLDMRGFAPLAGGMSGKKGRGSPPLSPDKGSAEDPVHPNEEQLMRLADLQTDVSLVDQITYHLSANGGSLEVQLGMSLEEASMDGSVASNVQGTATDDDPVDLAMRAVLDAGSVASVDNDAEASGFRDLEIGHGESEDEEEIILFQGNPMAQPRPPATMRVHQSHALGNEQVISGLPHHAPNVPPSSANWTTAQDLMQAMMRNEVRPPPASTSPHHAALTLSASGGGTPRTPTSAPLVGGQRSLSISRGMSDQMPSPHSPGLLFGGAPSGQGNIWAMTAQDNMNKTGRTGSGVDLSAIWSSRPGEAEVSRKDSFPSPGQISRQPSLPAPPGLGRSGPSSQWINAPVPATGLPLHDPSGWITQHNRPAAVAKPLPSSSHHHR